MNGLSGSRSELAALNAGLKGRGALPEILVCPPATLLHAFAQDIAGTPIKLGGQTCHPAPNGAHTGDMSAEMLKDAGAAYVIVGHSERRADHKEQSEDVATQARAAWRAGLTAIVCIGETEAERASGRMKNVLAAQINASLPSETTGANAALAYEPVWAIGTGKTASLADIEEAHAFIRERMEDHLGPAGRTIRILYGGSVKPSNAKEILNTPGVDGVLVGGASLKAADFLAIIAGARPA